MKLLTHEMKQYNYDCSAEDWKEFINKMDNREVVKIDEEMFYYWLEVLPPIYMNERHDIEIDGVIFNKPCSFGFCEGMDYVVDFWDNGKGNPKFCKKSNRINIRG